MSMACLITSIVLATVLLLVLTAPLVGLVWQAADYRKLNTRKENMRDFGQELSKINSYTVEWALLSEAHRENVVARAIGLRLSEVERVIFFNLIEATRLSVNQLRSSWTFLRYKDSETQSISIQLTPIQEQTAKFAALVVWLCWPLSVLATVGSIAAIYRGWSIAIVMVPLSIVAIAMATLRALRPHKSALAVRASLLTLRPEQIQALFVTSEPVVKKGIAPRTPTSAGTAGA